MSNATRLSADVVQTLLQAADRLEARERRAAVGERERVAAALLRAADQLESTSAVVKDAKGAAIGAGDVVRPDYSKPGWRLKTLKKGRVVSVAPGNIVVDWSTQKSGGHKGNMLIIMEKAGA